MTSPEPTAPGHGWPLPGWRGPTFMEEVMVGFRTAAAAAGLLAGWVAGGASGRVRQAARDYRPPGGYHRRNDSHSAGRRVPGRVRRRLLAQGAAGPADAPAGQLPDPPGGPGHYSLADALNGECREKPPKYPYPRVRAHPAVVLRRRHFSLPRRPEEHRVRLVRSAPPRSTSATTGCSPPAATLRFRYDERVQQPAHQDGQHLRPDRGSGCTATCGTGTSSACSSSTSGVVTF